MFIISKENVHNFEENVHNFKENVHNFEENVFDLKISVSHCKTGQKKNVKFMQNYRHNLAYKVTMLFRLPLRSLKLQDIRSYF